MDASDLGQQKELANSELVLMVVLRPPTAQFNVGQSIAADRLGVASGQSRTSAWRFNHFRSQPC